MLEKSAPEIRKYAKFDVKYRIYKQTGDFM